MPSPPAQDADVASARPDRAELAALAAIVLLAAACRIAALGQPMRYDESVTWALFSGRSWTTIVSWYPFPNNHVLHSLLAKATLAVAPWSPWALRLPAFAAGVAIVPLTWAVGRRFADRPTALLGAALAAGSTSLVLYSSNARGYSLVVALWLALLLVTHRLRGGATPAGWTLLALLGAAGLYTVPVMLYPLGAAALWLLLDTMRRPAGERPRRIAALAAACMAAVALALLAYLPIIRSSGLAALADNRFVAAGTWPALAAGMPRFLGQVVATWAQPLPWWSAPMLLALAAMGLPSRRAARHGPSLAVATLAWTIALLAATHRLPFVRVWLFILPLYLLAVARGALRVAGWLAARRGVRRGVRAPVAAVVVAAVTCVTALVTRAAERTDDTGAFPAAEALASQLAGRLRPGDRILAPIPANGPLLWYLSARGLDTAALNLPLARARRAWLVLDPTRGQTLEWAVGARLLDPREFTQPRLVARVPGGELWGTERAGGRE